jgi:hypothetical protein
LQGTACQGDSGRVIDLVVQDELGRGSESRPEPTVTLNGVTTGINLFPSILHSGTVCIHGKDTMRIVLYYAPLDADSMHKLHVQMGNLSVSTEPFRLRPAIGIDSFYIADDAGRPHDGPDTLAYPAGFLVLYAMQIDPAGNVIGPVQASWSTSGSLHPIPGTGTASRIFYETLPADGDEQGTICATIINAGDTLTDCVPVVILKPSLTTVLNSATTRDMNGDGMLDRIDLHFTGTISFPSNPAISVRYGRITFIPDSVVSVSGNSQDTSFYLYISDTSTEFNSIPQTAWKPYISISGIEGMRDVNKMVCTDGAPPVIWNAVATSKSIDTLNITMHLSEKILGRDESPFPQYLKVSNVINLWRFDELLGFIPLDYLDSLDGFESMDSDSMLKFMMFNGRSLTSQDYFNLKHGTGLLCDAAENFPDSANQKVRIQGLPHEEPRIDPDQNPPGRCGCGSGIGLALLPALVFKVRSRLLKKHAAKTGMSEPGRT